MPPPITTTTIDVSPGSLDTYDALIY